MAKLQTVGLSLALVVALTLHFTGHRDAAFWVALPTAAVGGLLWVRGSK